LFAFAGTVHSTKKLIRPCTTPSVTCFTKAIRPSTTTTLNSASRNRTSRCWIRSSRNSSDNFTRSPRPGRPEVRVRCLGRRRFVGEGVATNKLKNRDRSPASSERKACSDDGLFHLLLLFGSNYFMI
jgi:hypothetical protein